MGRAQLHGTLLRALLQRYTYVTMRRMSGDKECTKEIASGPKPCTDSARNPPRIAHIALLESGCRLLHLASNEMAIGSLGTFSETRATSCMLTCIHLITRAASPE